MMTPEEDTTLARAMVITQSSRFAFHFYFIFIIFYIY